MATTGLAAAALAGVLAGCGGGTTTTLSGQVSGLGAGLSVTLQNNGSATLTMTSNGSFTFDNALASNGTYNVAVLTQPAGQTCTVVNGSGGNGGNGDSLGMVNVGCTTTSSVGGTVSGLNAGASLVLGNAGADLVISANGSFAFPGLLAAGSAYEVTVVSQPVGQTCTVSAASGTVIANVLSSVAVTCQ